MLLNGRGRRGRRLLDAEAVVVGKAAAVEGGRPRIAVGEHGRLASPPHRLAHRAARVDVGGRGCLLVLLSAGVRLGLILDTNGRVQRAQEEPRVRMAADGEQRLPHGRLALDLAERVVAEVVGHAHALVADARAQAHARRYARTRRSTVQAGRAPVIAILVQVAVVEQRADTRARHAQRPLECVLFFSFAGHCRCQTDDEQNQSD